jgi:anti-sigma regulatory factor (Ser/Thr protein kinase)
MRQAFEIKTASDPRFLSVIRAAAGQIAQVAGFESNQIDQIKLAIDEVCTNIIRHTYKEDFDQEILLRFFLLENGLEICIQDFGEKIDPRVLQSRRKVHAQPGGLGLSLIQSVMDEIEFGLPTAVGNKCRLLKRKVNRET